MSIKITHSKTLYWRLIFAVLLAGNAGSITSTYATSPQNTAPCPCQALSVAPCEDCHASPCRECCTPPCEERRAFVKINTGGSYSRKANISVDPTFWDPALEGYNSDLGNAPIIGAGFGYKFFDFLSGDVSIFHRWNYKYSKFQTTPPNPATPHALPNKTRKFDLDSTSIMFNARLHGQGLGVCYATDNNGSYIAPILGAGIGFSMNKVSNFRSIFAPTAATTPSQGVSSIGTSSTTTTSFSYQFEAGLEYKFCGKWGLSGGYRWFDGGRFKGPSHILAGTGLPGNPIVGVASPQWKGKLRSNEFFVEATYYF